MSSISDARIALTRYLQEHDLFFNSVRLTSDRMVTFVKRVNTAQMISERTFRMKRQIEELLPDILVVQSEVKPWKGGRSIKMVFRIPSDMSSLWATREPDLCLVVSALSNEKETIPDEKIDKVLERAGNPQSIRAQAKALFKVGIERIIIVRALSRRSGKRVAYQQVYQATMNVVPRKVPLEDL